MFQRWKGYNEEEPDAQQGPASYVRSASPTARPPYPDDIGPDQQGAATIRYCLDLPDERNDERAAVQDPSVRQCLQPAHVHRVCHPNGYNRASQYGDPIGLSQHNERRPDFRPVLRRARSGASSLPVHSDENGAQTRDPELSSDPITRTEGGDRRFRWADVKGCGGGCLFVLPASTGEVHAICRGQTKEFGIFVNRLANGLSSQDCFHQIASDYLEKVSPPDSLPLGVEFSEVFKNALASTCGVVPLRPVSNAVRTFVESGPAKNVELPLCIFFRDRRGFPFRWGYVFAGKEKLFLYDEESGGISLGDLSAGPETLAAIAQYEMGWDQESLAVWESDEDI